LFVFDQKRRNASLDCLKHAVACSLTRPHQSVRRDTEIGAGPDQLRVPGRDRRRSSLRPLFCEPNFYGNAEALARLVERLINTCAAAVNDDDIAAVSRD
jgi:hypothetical protein